MNQFNVRSNARRSRGESLGRDVQRPNLFLYEGKLFSAAQPAMAGFSLKSLFFIRIGRKNYGKQEQKADSLLSIMRQGWRMPILPTTDHRPTSFAPSLMTRSEVFGLEPSWAACRSFEGWQVHFVPCVPTDFPATIFQPLCVRMMTAMYGGLARTGAARFDLKMANGSNISTQRWIFEQRRGLFCRRRPGLFVDWLGVDLMHAREKRRLNDFRARNN